MLTQRELIGYGTALAGVVCLALGAWAKGSLSDAVIALGTGLGVMSGTFGYANKPAAAPTITVAAAK